MALNMPGAGSSGNSADQYAAVRGIPRVPGQPRAGLVATVAARGTGADLRWRQVVRGEERQFAVLRQWLASLLPECPARDDVACVVTELGANAIRHTASGRGGWLSVEVT